MSWVWAFVTPTVLEETWECFHSACPGAGTGPAAGATYAKQRMPNPFPPQKLLFTVFNATESGVWDKKCLH